MKKTGTKKRATKTVQPKKVGVRKSSVRSKKKLTRSNRLIDKRMVVLAGIAVVLFSVVNFVDLSQENNKSAFTTTSNASVSLRTDTPVRSGDTFLVNMYADSQNIDVNAVQGVIEYPEDKLELKQIIVTDGAYPIEAFQDNSQAGKVEIVRGTTGSLNNEQLVAKLEFVAKNPGAANVIFDASNTFLVDSLTNENILKQNSYSNLALEVQ